MRPSFTPYDTLENAFRSWWLIVVFMLIGGLLGYAAIRTRSPLYEATAALSITIDFTRSGDLEDFEQDYVIGAAGDVISSSQVRDAVAARTGVSSADLGSRLFLERSYYVWTLRARDASPQRAAEVANAWAEEALDALSISLEQAMLADRFAAQLDQLEDCLVNPVAVPLCSDPAQIQSQIVSLTALESRARAGSGGIMPYTLFALVEHAAVPDRPSHFNQGQAVLSGALVGLLLSLFAIHLQLPSRLIQRTHRAP